MNNPCYLCEQYDTCSKTKRCPEWKPNKNLREFAIVELEKLKAEFYKCRDYIICNHNHTEMDMNKLDGIVLAIAITDERISELKGE